MKLNELRPSKGAVKARKRVGRGEGSGLGKTSGKGSKGQKSRSGYSSKLYFEGGQTPLVRRLPKVGFKCPSRVEYNVINVGLIESLEENVITPELLYSKGLIKKNSLVKVLGDGNLTKGKEVHANMFSKTAETKISEAKGKVVKL